jgi:RND family efflux transporter MFP subunit
MNTQTLNRTMGSLIADPEIAAPITIKETGRKPTGNKSNKTVRNLAGLVLAIGIGAVAYKWHGTAAPLADATAIQMPSVAVSTPLQRDLETRLGFLGQFAAVKHVEVRAQVGGVLTQINFKDGDVVHKGDALFTIDPTPYEIKLSQANAQLENATARLDLANQQLIRAKMLKKSDAGTTENVDQRVGEQKAAEAAVNEAKALVRDAKFDLDHTNITAPFTGRIGTHMASVGNLISGSRAGSGPTTILTTIVSLDTIYLNFDMSEAEYLKFARQRENEKGPIANKVLVSLSDENSFTHEGTLDFVDNSINRSSGTIRARATIPNKDQLLTPGGFGRVRLALSAPEPTLLVPDSSVMPDQSSHVVLTVDADNVVKAQQVKVGDLRGGLRVIRSGLAANDRVVVGSLTTTAPGAKISPTSGQIAFSNDQD